MTPKEKELDVLARTLWGDFVGPTMDNLQWRITHLSPDYEVSEYGHIRRKTPGRRTWPGRLMASQPHNFGYPTYKLTIDGKHRRTEAHRLVAFAFLGEPQDSKLEVAHKDGNPLNNHYSNLEWKTHKDNEADKKLHGTCSTGQRNSQAKLTEADVMAIRLVYGSVQSLTKVAEQFGIKFQTVSNIINRKSWSHI